VVGAYCKAILTRNFWLGAQYAKIQMTGVISSEGSVVWMEEGNHKIIISWRLDEV
jgi:hypothetical protein